MASIDRGTQTSSSGSIFGGLATPECERTFRSVSDQLSEKGFTVICSVFENDAEGLHRLVGDACGHGSSANRQGNAKGDIVGEVARRFGEIEAQVLADRVATCIDSTQIAAATYKEEVVALLGEVARRGLDGLKSAVDGNQHDLGKMRQEWRTILSGFGMGEPRPPYIEKNFAVAVKRAIAAADSPEALVAGLQEQVTKFLAEEDQGDFRELRLGQVETALREFGEGTGRASEAEGRSAHLGFTGSQQSVVGELPERQQEVLTDILKVFVAAQGEEGRVKDLLDNFPGVVEQLVSDQPFRENILSDEGGVKNPRAVAIVLEALIERSSSDRERLSLVKMTMPEALTFVGQGTLRALRADVGFDSVADLRRADDGVVDAVVKLEALTGNLELASSLVNRILQFPPDLFEVMKDTQNGQSIGEFEIAAVEETVDDMVKILRDSSGNTQKNLDKWRQTAPFQQLPSWYQRAVEREVADDRSTSASVEIVLKKQIEADQMGLDAEQVAENILNDLVKDGVIERFTKSLKGSDADRLGLDYCIWLPEGGVIYLDIKSSETGAYCAEGKRIEFAEQVQIHPSLAFIGPYEGEKVLFRRSELVVISPDSRYEINKASMVEALSRAMTLPDELRPSDVIDAPALWRSPLDGRSR